MTDFSCGRGVMKCLAATLLATGSCWPYVALAQQSDSATIDATATLSAAPPVLTLKPTDNLRFGTVQIPANAATGCTYQINKDGALVVLEDGKVTGSTACQFLDSAQGRGRVIVNCEPGLEIGFTVTPSVTSSDPAVGFNTTADFVSTNNSGLSAGLCLSDGTMDLQLGGQLFIDGTTRPIDGETPIGRILLEVQYNTGDGCQYCA